MATTPNQNPVPSEEYANMRFNAGKLDEFINSTVNTYVDRLGVTHMTVKGLQASAVGALLPANNLSDVADAATSRANISAAKSGANTDITSISGNAATATALATSRTFITNLASTSAAGFTGTANNSHGVTGTLPVANGGTGGTTQATARTSIGAASSTGVTDGSLAAAGAVGEYITATGTNTTLTTAVSANLTSISLTAGDWEVSGTAVFTPTAAAATWLLCGISTTSATFGSFETLTSIATAFNSSVSANLPTPTVRLSITATTTVYLVGSASFPAGSEVGRGFIRARRIR